MNRIASLAMYDAGGAAPAALWDTLRGGLEADGIADVPEDLSVPEDYDAAWLDAGLLLAQTCGYPLVHSLHGKVQYLGTPVYDVEGTEGPYYRSALVVRADHPAETLAELRGQRAAFNSGHSQSGYNAFRDAVARFAEDGRFFSSAIPTGSHAASVQAIITDKADIAAIDAVSLALMDEKIRNAIRVIGWTDKAPGLPLITSTATTHDDVNILRRNISYAFGDTFDSAARSYLKLSGFEVLPEGGYDSILAMEQRALDRSYPLLA
jgi:ABC-type phosphate/phosphonate transport system substrate-binding protein